MRVGALPLLLVSAFTAHGWTVCLDPGHGGSDPGATGTYYLEKEANLDVAYQALNYLSMVPDCEWAGMTRTGDYTVSLVNRVAYANQNGFDRFMSIHENAFNTYVQGSETFCYSLDPGTPGYDLASRVLDDILWAHGYSNRGVKDGSWIYVIANTTMPAILGEGSFIDYDAAWNESHRYFTNWNDHSGRQGFAYARGISLHMGSTPPEYGSEGHIVDNLSPGFSVNSEADWNTGSYGEPWGPDYRWSSTTNQADWARWTPNLPEAGWHEVSVWYTHGSNRAPDAVYTVHHQGGETQFIVDQTQNGGQWILLGDFPFSAGISGWVTLSEAGTTPERVVIADAVKFEMGSTGMDHSLPAVFGTRLEIAPNPGTAFQIRFTLPVESGVHLAVYDIAGRLVETIHNGAVFPGESLFAWNPSGQPSGMYLVTAGSREFNLARRVLLLD